MAPTIIYNAPTFTTVRSESGAIAADSADILDANYPTDEAVQAPAGSTYIEFYWYAGGGTVEREDWLDIQILYRDAKAPVTARWIEGPTAHGVRQNESARLPAHGNNQCYLRVARVNCASGTGLVVQAAVSK
jgi:hypothetical protein